MINLPKLAIKISLLFLMFINFSCNKNNDIKLVEGNIYITLINLYDTQSIVLKDKIEEFKKAIINFNYKNKSNAEKELNDYYKTLIENDLLNKHSFQLKLENEEIINVYIDNNEYLKLEKELGNLNRDKEQIRVKFKGSKISNGVNDRAIYAAIKIIFIEKNTGKTEWQK